MTWQVLTIQLDAYSPHLPPLLSQRLGRFLLRCLSPVGTRPFPSTVLRTSPLVARSSLLPPPPGLSLAHACQHLHQRCSRKYSGSFEDMWEAVFGEYRRDVGESGRHIDHRSPAPLDSTSAICEGKVIADDMCMC